MLTLVQQVRFFAAHYYWVNEWSDVQNKAIFGACSNREGHGHNYSVTVYLAGQACPKTGMLINFFDLHPLLHKAIVEPLDHQNLNTQVAWFTKRVPTLENITAFIIEQLQTTLADTNLTLQALTVKEHDGLWVTYHAPQDNPVAEGWRCCA